jgi:hypothetical protein
LQAGLWDVVNNLSTSAVGFSELIFSALTVLEGAKKQDFVMMLWCLWRRRNDKVCLSSLQEIFCINGVVLDIMTATQLHNPSTNTRGGSLQSQEQ